MNLLKIIQKNKELEPLFLKFMYWHVQLMNLEDAPRTLENINTEQLTRHAWEEVNMELIERMIALYKLPIETEEDHNRFNELIFGTCHYYEEKYGFDKISEMIKKLPGSIYNPIDSPKPAFDHILKAKRLLELETEPCNTCKTVRKRLDYIELSSKMQKVFAPLKDATEYFLYCPKCDEYSSMGFSEAIGFDEN